MVPPFCTIIKSIEKVCWSVLGYLAFFQIIIFTYALKFSYLDLSF